ncbi:41095_t:CDS:2 [Gigaspora margarita]|uniref:41095_t:CDS:1 n=1 Tax=Gigaspora margarita TaxID=4874 RepID=A0ABN7VIG2_GIGMA|nr:41095_t:CDS:2 [Gigaspora margarita]
MCKQCLEKRTKISSKLIVEMNFDEFKQFIQDEVDKLDFTKDIFKFDIQINFIENSKKSSNELASLLCNEIEKQDVFKWHYWKMNYSNKELQNIITNIHNL